MNTDAIRREMERKLHEASSKGDWKRVRSAAVEARMKLDNLGTGGVSAAELEKRREMRDKCNETIAFLDRHKAK
jgi:hypothetical protein